MLRMMSLSIAYTPGHARVCLFKSALSAGDLGTRLINSLLTTWIPQAFTVRLLLSIPVVTF